MKLQPNLVITKTPCRCFLFGEIYEEYPASNKNTQSKRFNNGLAMQYYVCTKFKSIGQFCQQVGNSKVA